jgi:hypothetical protein
MDLSKALLRNCIASLYNIDHYLLPELNDEDWSAFRKDPARYFINTHKEQSDAIWREVLKRQRPVEAP